jgi:signal transduction histidine kinase
MLLSFTTIYLITYNNVYSDINTELFRLSDKNVKLPMPKDDLPPHNFKTIQPPQEHSLTFTLITDMDENIEFILTIFDMEDEFYENAKEIALSQNLSKGTFKLDGNHWAYTIRHYLSNDHIIFLDISSQHNILTNLIYTFIAVGIFMFICIYIISNIFANKSIQPIKDAFEKQKQFIADASHELKTPLAVINTNVDVLLAGESDDRFDHSKWLHYIKSEVERMGTLTNDLLYLTQMDYSDIQMIFSDFNMSQTVENIILTMEAILFEKNITFQYTLVPNLMIRGNVEQIKQVIMILLDNAIKYTNEKGEINLILKKSNNTLQFSVTNTGEGISNEHITKIFDRFYRADNSRTRKNGGYGLGLAIAKTIIEQHNGFISVNSIQGERTTFTIELPLSKA